jgi:hypothetical protein
MTKKELNNKMNDLIWDHHEQPSILCLKMRLLINRHTIMKPQGYMEKRQAQVTGFLGFKPLSTKGLQKVTKELTTPRKKKRTNKD